MDDDRAMRTLLKVAMEEEGYRVIEAKNGQQCLEEYNRAKPDMILLDAIMPEMDGFTCCQQLRALQNDVYLPILMITALDDQDSIDQAFVVGATDYVTKPIYWSVLSQRVRHLLETSQALQELQSLKYQLERQQQWQTLWQHLTGQLTKPFQIKSLLQKTINELRTLVNAQRVGLSQVNDKFLVESIEPGYPSVKTLSWDKLTGFEEYKNTYEAEQIVMIDLLSQTDIPQTAIAPWEQLTIKSLAMVPIMGKEGLFAILWIHHCQSSYQWESWEVECLSYLRDLLGLTTSYHFANIN
ncbi:two-component sensor histidine kinase [Aphanothece sacrum FPU1]|uniref:Two-component sensor histidine kinase n=1 Tax=Aphanothece sacrum FPU1 TaxID=1920663 RepID=A0A401IJE1_APHSA|nr:two-component sensor histidine kinase [Aphanothece sacrum FPU1]